MRELQPIDRAECLRLLAGQRFGRLAVNVRGRAPAIRPVNYIFDSASQSIVFRTASGSKLHGMLVSEKAAFEIDGLDLRNRTGWSVVVTGVAEEVVNPAELRRLERLPLDPWAPGEKPHWVRLRVWTVSGRRVVDAEAGDAADPAAGKVTATPSA
jgi:nitroimidazol reductase NimA-like FMN-containing flavoprotein (pyridoxamine 5'-phosphate oxidase superfamily)